MTTCYPQLSTGATGQFPLTKAFTYRTIENRLIDGSSIRLADADATTVAWNLEYRGLTTEERTLLESFFASVAGPLKTFLFLDPCGNLLRYSDDLSNAVWAVDSLLRADPIEGLLVVTNASQTSQSFRQRVAAPAAFRYCGSALLRCEENITATAFLSGAVGKVAFPTRVGSEWTVVSASGIPGGDTDEVTFGIELPAGVRVQVSGLQLEAQPGRSGYKRTSSVNGCFTETRFDQSSLHFRADGLNDFATTVRLISRVRLP